MLAIIFAVAGAVIGAIAGFALEILSGVMALVTCSGGGTGLGVLEIPLAILGAVIGAIIGFYTDREEKERADKQAEEKRLREEQADRDAKYSKWEKSLIQTLKQITENIYCGTEFEPGNVYDSVWEFEKIHPEERYNQRYKELIEWHKGILRDTIKDTFSHFPGYFAVLMGLSALKCLKAVDGNDPGYDPAIAAVEKLAKHAGNDTFYLEFRQYGDCLLKVENIRGISDLDRRIERLNDKVLSMLALSRTDYGEKFEKLPEFATAEYIDMSCELMWCYAAKKPFEQETFTYTKNLFSSYTVKCLVDMRMTTLNYAAECAKNKKSDNVIRVENVESLLSLIYAKNQMGGYNTVIQEKERIERWLNNMVAISNYDQCFLLASGLAWMGLYELEKNVLRQLVSLKVTLPVDIYDRLNFLESGGTSNIKVYEIDNRDEFLFDNSSVDWNADAFELFFRKVELSHKTLEYSLAISKWTKTWPLEHGQKISDEQIEKAFSMLVLDFDGEVTLRTQTARVLNLANVEYKDAYIFCFDGNKGKNRNRCVTVLFSCEKYGRNLNMTIITLFTPETGLSVDELKKYALAIKDNIYVESFKESIAQAMDEVIKIKQSVYDEAPVSSKKVFD